nr:putative capsid protein [Hypera postica associated permutotetravirus]
MTEQKNVVCPQCGKRFVNKSALEQHKIAKGCVGKTPTRRGPRRGRRAGRGQRAGGGPDPAPSRVPVTASGSVTLGGEDRIGSFVASTREKVFKSFTIAAGTSLRLDTMSRAFQRMKWNQCEVTVTPQAPLTVSGGYICGFIMDPEDESVTASQLLSAQGSTAKKWYETAVIRMPKKPDLLYTSSGTDPRLSSPGRFWVVGEGEPSSNITILVTMRWNVTLTNPTMEQHSDLSFILNGKLIASENNYNLQYVPPGGTAQDDAKSAFPTQIASMSSKQFYRVPSFGIEYSEGTGDTGTIVCHFIVFEPKDGKCYYSVDGETINTTKWQGDVNIQVCVPCGTVCKYDGEGEGCKPAPQSQGWSASHNGPNYAVPLTAVTQLQSRLMKSSLTMLQSPKSCSPKYETPSRRDSTASTNSFVDVRLLKDSLKSSEMCQLQEPMSSKVCRKESLSVKS